MKLNLNSPLPPIWKTHPKGKIYVYNRNWKNLLQLIQENKKFKITREQISKKLQINKKTLRIWSNSDTTPKLYTKEEFNFTKPNLYWIGLFYSDGHLRNNGAQYSYTYQTESSNIFQGYWYPHILQKFFPIFKHKDKPSTICLRNCNNRSWTFRTNLSGISPIFIQFLQNQKIIQKRINKFTGGYSKYLPSLKQNKEIFFQGLFDGDGSIKIYNKSLTMDLALEPNTQIYSLIKNFNLVPTLAITTKRKGIPYHKNLKEIYSIRLAPTSINKLNQKIYSAKDIVNQLDFMLSSAKNSIRPDKVHELIKIIQTICSKKYGENSNSIPVQKEIRNLANKRNLKEKANQLEKQYLIKDNKYLQFQPLWAKELCSKKEWFSEAWDFFFNLENLNLKNYPNKKKFDFEEGIPIDFKL